MNSILIIFLFFSIFPVFVVLTKKITPLPLIAINIILISFLFFTILLYRLLLHFTLLLSLLLHFTLLLFINLSSTFHRTSFSHSF